MATQPRNEASQPIRQSVTGLHQLVARALAISALTSTAVFVVLYLSYGAWQILLGAVAMVVAFGLHQLWRLDSRYHEPERFSRRLVLSVLVACGGLQVAWAGATPQIATGAILITVLVGVILLPMAWRLWLAVTAGFSVGCLVLDALHLPFRFAAGQTHLPTLLTLLTTCTVLAVLWQGVKLTRRLRILEVHNDELQETSAKLQRQLHELRVLHDVAVAGTQAETEDELIERATHIIGESLYPDSFGLILVDSQTGTLLPHPTYHIRDSRAPFRPIPMGKGISGEAVESGEPIQVDDVSRWPNYICYDPKTRSEISVPMKIGDEVFGVVNAESRTPAAFTEADLRLLVTFAGQLATAIARLRALQTAQHQVRQTEAMYGVARGLSSAVGISELLGEASRLITDALHVYNTEIALLEAGELVVYGGHGGYGEPVAGPPYGPHQKIGEGIIGAVAQTGEALLVPDVSTSAQYLATDYLPDVKAELAVPLVAKNGVIGVIDVKSDLANGLGANDMRFLEALATQISIAVQNAGLYQAALDSAKRFAVLHEVSQEILRAGVDLEVVYQAIHKAVAQLMPCESFVISWLSEQRQEIDLVYAVDRGGRQPPIAIALGDGLSSHILASGKAVLVADTGAFERDTRVIHFGYPEHVRSLIAVPLQLGGKTYGMLSTQSYQMNAYTVEHQQMLELAAAYATASLQNARLFAQVQEHAAELARAVRRLEELDTLKDEVIQNVSHELRTPLAIVRGYVELLRSGELGDLPPAQIEPLDVIGRRIDMLTKIVDDLTVILEVEAQRMRHEPLDLVALTRLAVADFQVAFQNAGVALEAVLDPATPMVYGDPTKLRRVLDNLISNALKFTFPEGAVTVHLSHSDGLAVLEVSDTGIGIPADRLERVFERFYQVDGSPSRRYGGTGLGLALVKEIVEALGGTVSVSSRLGEGSTFSVRLPTVQGIAAA